MPDWAYDTIGWILLAAGLPLLAWSLLWDPARRRRRCPRCWYSREGTPGLRCPECGREARSERSLYRVRRRWRWATAALLMLVGAYAAAVYEGVRARGWWAAVPRPALPWALAYAPDQPEPAVPGPLVGEIRARYFAAPRRLRTLWPGERWALGHAAAAALSRADNPSNLTLAAELLVHARRDAAEIAPERARAYVVLEKSLLAYASCRTYRDIGLMQWRPDEPGPVPFMTAYRRPDAVRLEFLDPGPPDSRGVTRRCVAWGDGGPFRRWDTYAGVVGTRATAPDAVDSTLYPYGGQGGAGGWVQSVLSGLLGSRSLPSVMRKATILREEEFDGHRCFVVSAVLPGGGITTWIDAESFAVRKYRAQRENGAVVVYRPEFDAELPASVFEFDPAREAETPLGDGKHVVQALGSMVGRE